MKTQVLLLISSFLLIQVIFGQQSSNKNITKYNGKSIPASEWLGVHFSSPIAWHSEIQFTNLMSRAYWWRISQVGSTEILDKMDRDGLNPQIPSDSCGYPLQIPYDGKYVWTYVIYNQNENYPGGHYVVLYDGEGDVTLQGDAVEINGSRSPGRFEANVTPTHNGFLIYLKSSKLGNHVRNIRILPIEYEFTHQQNLFQNIFLKKAAPFGFYRFMGWQNVNNSPLSKWNQRAYPGHYTYSINRGVPYEVIAEFANKTGKDIWVCVPHQADSNYIANMAKIFRDSIKNKDVKIFVEYSNEVFNTGWFNHGSYVVSSKSPVPSALKLNQAHAAAWMQAWVHKIWSKVFSGQQDRLIRVGSVKQWDDNYCSSFMEVITNPLYSEGIDFLVTGAYISPRTRYIELSANSSKDDVMKLMWSVMEESKDLLMNIKKIADKYNLPLGVYEGGQHLQGSERMSAINAMRDAQYTQSMYELTLHWLAFHYLNDIKFFDYFSLVGTYGESGFWGALEHLYQTEAESFKYKALLDFIKMDSTQIANFYQQTVDKIAPVAPQNLKIERLSDKSYRLSWKQSSDDRMVRYYKVYRNDSLVISNIGTLNFDMADLQENRNYTFLVIAVDRQGNESEPSNKLEFNYITTKIGSEIGTAELSVFPNPVEKKISINYESNTRKIDAQLYSIDGTLLKTITFNGVNFMLDIEQYKPGFYLLKLLDNNHLILNKLILKK